MSEIKRFDIQDIARILQMRKLNNHFTVLILGSRAGGLFRSEHFYNSLQKFSNRDFSKLSLPEQFGECYSILTSGLFNDVGIHSILRASLQDLDITEADACVAELVKQGYFDEIISTNIDDMLEDAFREARMKEGREFEVFIAGRETSYEKGLPWRMTKAFGDFSSRFYTIRERLSYVDRHKELRLFLERVLARDLLVVGIDPIWDEDILRVISGKSAGTVCLVNDEKELIEHPLLSFLTQKSQGAYIVDPIGSYEQFFTKVCRFLGVFPNQQNTRQRISHEVLQNDKERVEIYISHAIEDENLKNELVKHIYNSGLTDLSLHWHDDTTTGEQKNSEFDPYLDSAQIILLLISADYLASDYLYQTEVTRAMERHQTGKARVLPVILRPTNWMDAPFGKIQVLPQDALPVTRWSNLDDALLDIVQGVTKTIEEIKGNSFTRPIIPAQTEPINIFYCYSHKDLQLRNELSKHLALMRRTGLIAEWYDGMISPGSDRQSEITKHLYQAQIIMVLISPAFLESDYAEMQVALARHVAGDAYLLPVILSETDWQNKGFGKRPPLPSNGKPITSPDWPSLDDAFEDVVKGIREVIQQLSTERSAEVPSAVSSPVSELTYTASLYLSANQVFIGKEIKVTIHLTLASTQEVGACQFHVPYDEAAGSELNILLTAPGFQFSGENVASLPMGIPIESEETTKAISTRQVARFALVALRPGITKIVAELFVGSKFERSLETEVQINNVDANGFSSHSTITLRSRPTPQPDLILQVQTEWNAQATACTFHYVLDSFNVPLSISENYSSPSLDAGWVERSLRLLGKTLEDSMDGQLEYTYSRLVSLGYYLFRQVFPAVLQDELRNLAQYDRLLTLLILADQDAWLPWEIVHTGKAFLGDQFVIGRWLRELDKLCPYEFPVGVVQVAPYANAPRPELWSNLLSFLGVPQPFMLPQGEFTDLATLEEIRGLYLIRSGQPRDATHLLDAPVQLDKTNSNIDTRLRPTKLNLRRNRPLVNLGYVSAGQSELTMLEKAWAPAFVHAGCSAFVGPLWAVQPAVEEAFISGFYSCLWTGDSLAAALLMGRRHARAAVPDSLDWLAYVLFGDPMARPYRPIPGQGYALVEPIGRGIDEPLQLGNEAHFRVSLRRKPPVWYEERVIEVTETLAYENLQVHIIVFDLDVIPTLPISLTPTSSGDYMGEFTLYAPPTITVRKVRVQVHFVDGTQPIHSLMFPMTLV